MITIAGREFKTKKQLHEFLSRALKQRLDKHNGELTAQQEEFLLALLQRHPDAENKIGCGVAKILLTKNHGGHPHLLFIRKDGTRDSFSWVSCISERPRARNFLPEALRWAVASSVYQEKLEAFDSVSKCYKCEMPLNTFSEFEMDHTNPTFKQIADEFFSTRATPVQFVKEKLGRTALVDKALEKEWIRFHNKWAVLAPVCKPCHVEKTSGKPRDKKPEHIKPILKRLLRKTFDERVKILEESGLAVMNPNFIWLHDTFSEEIEKKRKETLQTNQID